MTTSYTPTIHETSNGTLYLKEPGVALVGMTQFFPEGANKFVNSFDDEFDAIDYENDWYVNFDKEQPNGLEQKLDGGAALCKFAGQTCYLSYGEKRTRNDPPSVKKYFDNIKSSGHGSVVQHANYSFIIWGIDRACSHELVRHGTGTAFSQLSQRYVSGKTLRFVERPEYQDNEQLHAEFEKWIDLAAAQYDLRAQLLSKQLNSMEVVEMMTATEKRKAVNQSARNSLPNETETAMVMTANVRAWRHIIEQRASQHADSPINKLMLRIGSILKEVSPVLFEDYTEGFIPATGRSDLSTPWKKV